MVQGTLSVQFLQLFISLYFKKFKNYLLHPRKTAHCFQKGVGKNIKDKKRDKRGRDGDPSWEGSLKKERISKHQETLSPVGLWQVLGSQWATELGGKINK